LVLVLVPPPPGAWSGLLVGACPLCTVLVWRFGPVLPLLVCACVQLPPIGSGCAPNHNPAFVCTPTPFLVLYSSLPVYEDWFRKAHQSSFRPRPPTASPGCAPYHNRTALCSQPCSLVLSSSRPSAPMRRCEAPRVSPPLGHSAAGGGWRVMVPLPHNLPGHPVLSKVFP
jgi:hypothetical protein